MKSCCFFYQNTEWLYLLMMSRTRFRVNPHSIVAWMSSLSDCNGTGTNKQPLSSETNIQLFRETGQFRLQTKWLWVWVPLQSLKQRVMKHLQLPGIHLHYLVFRRKRKIWKWNIHDTYKVIQINRPNRYWIIKFPN